MIQESSTDTRKQYRYKKTVQVKISNSSQLW